MPKKSSPPSYYLLTLGCPKNVVDSDGMATLLDQQGYQVTADPDQADVLIVNTCGFLAAAKAESIAVLQELSEGKKKRQVLVAAGCMAERSGAEILTNVPGVDGMLGTRRWMDIIKLVERLRGGRGKRNFAQIEMLGDTINGSQLITPRAPIQNASAYLKISDGCNAPCTFCSIPTFKGKLRSHPFEAVVSEAQTLAAAGAKELIVVAQDTTDYGRDQGEANSLARLLHAIASRAEGLDWLRLMYAYPGHVTDELIEVMASTPQILPYLDIPLQHGHADTLRRMKRPSNVKMVDDTIVRLRAAMPEIAIRTTFIVGYPGETEEEFQGLLDFVESAQFDKVGAFTFSPEPGTPAATLPDQVPEDVKEERWERLMTLQQPISLARNQMQVGRILPVLVEGHGDGLTLARSYRDAPEVDGFVLIEDELPLGEIQEVRITGAMEYDLVGTPVVGIPISPIASPKTPAS